MGEILFVDFSVQGSASFEYSIVEFLLYDLLAFEVEQACFSST